MKKTGIFLGIVTVLLICFFVTLFACFGNITKSTNSGSTIDETVSPHIDTTAVSSKDEKNSDEKSALVETRDDLSNKNRKNYTVVFKDENGEVLSEQIIDSGGEAEAPKAPEKEGYYFYSWSRSFSKVTGDMVITPIYLKGDSVPQIVADQVTAKAGDKKVAVKVSVKNNPGVASAALDILYDKERLRLTDFVYNTKALHGASTVPYNEKADPLCLSMVNGSENITGDFLFATLYFELLDDSDGNYPIILNCDAENVYNIDEQNIAFKLVNGLITVK